MCAPVVKVFDARGDKRRAINVSSYTFVLNVFSMVSPVLLRQRMDVGTGGGGV